MTGHAGVEYRCRTSECGKLIITERTTYRRMDEWVDMQGLNIDVALVNVANHLY